MEVVIRKCFFEKEIFFIEEYEECKKNNKCEKYEKCKKCVECEKSQQVLAKEKVCVKKLRLIDTIKFSNKSESIQSRYNMVIIEDIIIDRDILDDGFVRIENLGNAQSTYIDNMKSSKYRYNLLKVNDSSKLKFNKIGNEYMQSLESTENTIKEFSDIEADISEKVSPCSDPLLIIENIGHGNYVKVEQGDFTISVDCGGNVAFKKRNIIDVFVLTHWHEDHMYYLDEIYKWRNSIYQNMLVIVSYFIKKSGKYSITYNYLVDSPYLSCVTN